VALIDDQQPAGDLAAQGGDHPLAHGIRPGYLRRAEEDPDACGGEYGIDGAGELAGAVPDQEPVGLEYSTVAVTCFLSRQRGPVVRRSGTRG
jgi:hypothetical protein